MDIDPFSFADALLGIIRPSDSRKRLPARRARRLDRPGPGRDRHFVAAYLRRTRGLFELPQTDAKDAYENVYKDFPATNYGTEQAAEFTLYKQAAATPAAALGYKGCLGLHELLDRHRPA